MSYANSGSDTAACHGTELAGCLAVIGATAPSLHDNPRCSVSNKVTKLKTRKPAAALDTPTDLDSDAVAAVSEALNGLLADSYALYLKTKNFHWHVSGPHFR